MTGRELPGIAAGGQAASLPSEGTGSEAASYIEGEVHMPSRAVRWWPYLNDPKLPSLPDPPHVIPTNADDVRGMDMQALSDDALLLLCRRVDIELTIRELR